MRERERPRSAVGQQAVDVLEGKSDEVTPEVLQKIRELFAMQARVWEELERSARELAAEYRARGKTLQDRLATPMPRTGSEAFEYGRLTGQHGELQRIEHLLYGFINSANLAAEPEGK